MQELLDLVMSEAAPLLGSLQGAALLPQRSHPAGVHRAREVLPLEEAPAGRMSVLALEDAGALTAWVPEWQELAASAMESNVFYEPWMLLPAIEAFGRGRRLIFVMVFLADGTHPSGRPQLCGFFPFERVRRWRGLPSPALRLWRHAQCLLCTPLIRAEQAVACLRELVRWARSDPRGAPILQFAQVRGDGPFRRSLVDFLQEHEHPACVHGLHNRALLVLRGDSREYLSASVPRRSRKELQRQERRISAAGTIAFTSLRPESDLDRSIDQFLALETSRRRGRSDGALEEKEADRRFFAAISRQAFRRGRLMMLEMRLGGRPVAMKCSLLAGEGSFAFKTTYGESYGSTSPGMLLEAENIRRLHEAPGVRWMDSCAASSHSMVNRLWIDRRTIQTFVVATGRPMGDLLVSAMPLMRWIADKVWPPRANGAAGAGPGAAR